MEGVPSIWRTELLHPLSVHFPIALLSLSALVGIAFFIFHSRNFAPHLRFSMSLLLWCGIVLFWLAFYTGQEAYTIVVRTLCDPTVLKDHLYWSYVSGYIFSAATVLDIIRMFTASKLKTWFNIAVLVLLLGGTVAISYVGHLGASVVYQQAGGVYVPSEDCGEFE